MVVLRVAHAHGVVRRQAQRFERRDQAAGLVHTGRQHHHRALVEDDLQLQPQLADHLQHDRVVRLPGRHDAAPHGERLDTAFLQLANEGLRWRVGQRPFLSGRRRVEQRTVFRDDEIEHVKLLAAYTVQVVEFAPGDEQDAPAGGGSAPKCLLGRGVHHAMVGHGAVIVATKRQQARQAGAS